MLRQVSCLLGSGFATWLHCSLLTRALASPKRLVVAHEGSNSQNAPTSATLGAIRHSTSNTHIHKWLRSLQHILVSPHQLFVLRTAMHLGSASHARLNRNQQAFFFFLLLRSPATWHSRRPLPSRLPPQCSSLVLRTARLHACESKLSLILGHRMKLQCHVRIQLLQKAVREP